MTVDATGRTDTTTSLADRVAADGVRFLLVVFVDLTGKPCAKLVPASCAGQVQADGVGFAGYAAGAIGQQPHDPDLVVVPDPSSYTPVPAVREGLAVVHGDPHVEGAPWPYAPRVILRRALERTPHTLMAGAEVEYFLLARDADGTLRPADARDDAAQPCYDARGLTRMYDHLTEVSGAMDAMGWGNYANDHEDANGQFEQNFGFADALTTADRVITARYVISVLAEARGMTATFMPKPFTDRTGSGMHLHLSLWDHDHPLFPTTGADGPGAHGLGLSPLADGFLGGVLDHAPGLQALLGPTVNSYKRTGAAAPRSGATWSPSRATYGGNDRTHFVRVPDGDRIELRGADGSTNPYLALAGTLAAGLDGVARSLDPGPPGTPLAPVDGPELPPTLLHAVDALAADPVVSGALDGAGAPVAAYFAELKRREFLDWHGTVGSWEIDRYLTAF